MPIGSQTVCGCFRCCAGRVEDLPKMFTIWSFSGHWFPTPVLCANNSGEGRAAGQKTQRSPGKPSDFPPARSMKNIISLACHPPQNGHKMAKTGSADLSRAWSWNEEDTFEIEGPLTTRTWAEAQVWPLGTSMNRCQQPRSGLQQSQDACGPDCSLPASLPWQPIFDTSTILSFQDLSCNSWKKGKEQNVDLSDWNQNE